MFGSTSPSTLYPVIVVVKCEEEWAVGKYHSVALFNGTTIADSDCATLIQPVAWSTANSKFSGILNIIWTLFGHYLDIIWTLFGHYLDIILRYYRKTIFPFILKLAANVSTVTRRHSQNDTAVTCCSKSWLETSMGPTKQHTHDFRNISLKVPEGQSNWRTFTTPYICVLLEVKIRSTICMRGSRDSSVGIATRYRLGGPGIKSRWGQGFPHPSRPALRPTQPPIQWVPGLSRG